MIDTKFTPGPWIPANMIHDTEDRRLTPEEVGEYIKNCVKATPEIDDFFFIFADTPEGERDICHVGNGKTSHYNAKLISAAPDLYEALDNILSDRNSNQVSEKDRGVAERAMLAARGES